MIQIGIATPSTLPKPTLSMSEDVMYRHIDLYVNEYSVDLGAEGRRAVELLFDKAAATGIIPPTNHSLFLR